MNTLLKNCDAALITSNINRRYLTGFNSSAGMYLITKDKNYFLTDFRYIVEAKDKVQNAEIIMTTIEKPYNDLVLEILREKNVKELGLEFDTLTVSAFEGMKKSFLDVNFYNISLDLHLLRDVKTEDELTKMKASQDITDAVFLDVLDFIKENYKKGITEKDIAAEIVSRIYKRGADAISFAPIVASGANGAFPHAKPSDKKIVEGEFITMDFGSLLDGYCSDMTRTVAVGSVTPEMEKIYNLVLEAQLLGIKTAKAGLIGSDIHNTVYKFFEENGVSKYFGHGFGHGIGMEVHEHCGAGPRNTGAVLPENAVISAEPGLYIEGSCGVRIEDVLILTKDGNINITNSKKDLIIL